LLQYFVKDAHCVAKVQKFNVRIPDRVWG
jgi:hypothetical protein